MSFDSIEYDTDADFDDSLYSIPSRTLQLPQRSRPRGLQPAAAKFSPSEESDNHTDPILLLPQYKDQVRPAGFEIGDVEDGAVVPMAQSVRMVMQNEPYAETLPAAVMEGYPPGINAIHTLGSASPTKPPASRTTISDKGLNSNSSTPRPSQGDSNTQQIVLRKHMIWAGSFIVVMLGIAVVGGAVIMTGSSESGKDVLSEGQPPITVTSSPSVVDKKLGCDVEDMHCFETSNHHRKLFAQGLIDSIYNFFLWLLNLIDIFNIIPDPPTSPPSSAPTVSPTSTTLTSAPTIICLSALDDLFLCLNTDQKCSECLKEINLGVLPDSFFDPTTCDALKAEACSNLKNKWSLCSCAVCKTEAEDYYGCLMEDFTLFDLQCSDNLCCFADDCGGPAPPSDVCFSPFNTVNVRDKGTIFINQLQIGDLVNINEKGEYSRVYSFGHLDPKSKTNYLQIFAEGLSQPLEISPNHLLYVNGKLTPAFQVKKSDRLNSKSKVSWITSIQRHGKYAPLTEAGTIRISGVDASSYVLLSNILPSKLVSVLNAVPYSFHHAISHGWTAPRRWACALDFDICKEETYKVGYASWFYSTLQFSSKLGETPKQVQIGFAIVAAPCLLTLYSPLFLVTLVFYSMFHRYKNASIMKKITKFRSSGSSHGSVDPVSWTQKFRME